MRVWVLAAVASLATALPAAAGDYARGHDSVWAQRDIPGDYRCDAYWDRGRDDCDAAWRTRHLRHDGRGHHRRPRYYEPPPRHAPPVRRDPGRIDWCVWRFRSYDPRTGYYLGYSGRYHFCG